MEGGEELVECSMDIFVSFFGLLGLGVWECEEEAVCREGG